MSRTFRVVMPGCPYHITQRGNNRQKVFFDDQDHLSYLNLLKRYTQKYKLDVWSYCLMPNHVHLLVVPHEEHSLARGIGVTNMTYTQYVNKKYRRVGRVWQNRFFSSHIENDSYLWAVSRYIENNPVAAGLVGNAEDFEWSSARHHVQQEPDPLISSGCWITETDLPSYRSFLKEDNKKVTAYISQAASKGLTIC